MNEVIMNLDANNHKALEICNLTLTALDNSFENIDVITSLEVIRDYLQMNDDIGKKAM